MISHDRLRSPSICFDLPRSQVRESGLETLRLSFRGCDAFADEVAELLVLGRRGGREQPRPEFAELARWIETMPPGDFERRQQAADAERHDSLEAARRAAEST